MELTLDQALQKGIEAHKAGQVQEADQYYTAILKANPKHPDANHNMGVLGVGVGKVEEALSFFKTALEVNPKIEQFWLSYIDALIKLDRLADAKAVSDQAKSKGAKGDGFEQIEKRLGSATSKSLNAQDPSQEELKHVVNLYTQGKYKEAQTQASQLLKEFSNSATLYSILGSTNKSLGQLDEAIAAYNKALSIMPNYAAAYNNMGNALKDQGKLEEAIKAFKKAISLTPNYATAYNNMGLALQGQGRAKEAIKAFKKAISIKPDYAEALNDLGIAFEYEDSQEKALEAFNKALSIKPDFAKALNNKGCILNDQGKTKKALEAFNKALSIKPDYAEAHRHLSAIKKYTENDSHFFDVQALYKLKSLSDDARCHLNFALAKMYEDIGKLDQAYYHLSKGNDLRKKLLNYSIDQDKNLFRKLKRTKSVILKSSLKEEGKSDKPKPIFILGMPRSGTTLVEQIISSHSNVTGGGELRYVSNYGFNLAIDPEAVESAKISEFRIKYSSELARISKDKHFVTDKMPQNFRFIPLIFAAFPKAKIVHVKRDVAATCWSNFKQYFSTQDLGYCYDLKDIKAYYKLYNDLMKLWRSDYGDRIYNLDYDQLTINQEKETRDLIAYLELTWEKVCLSPHKNKRSVKTASQRQVRNKIYQGSSKAWLKYKPFLCGAFDNL